MPPPPPPPPASDPHARRAFSLHPRLWQQNRYVYPVLSRRSKGISLGINLNPDKLCNFDCIYCSVDRTKRVPPPPWATGDVDLDILRSELAAMLDLVSSGELYNHDPFDKIPAPLRRLNDIAFSGDGEPTTCPQFDQAVHLAADLAFPASLRRSVASSPPPIKLVLITNATLFHRPEVQKTLAFLDEHHGEIWAKLDAGTPDYYDLVDRTAVPFQRILDNLAWCCRTRPTVIQSLFMRVHGNSPPPAEIVAYAARLAAILRTGGHIQLVQLYTVARSTTEPYATALTEPELDAIAQHIHTQLPSLPIETYP